MLTVFLNFKKPLQNLDEKMKRQRTETESVFLRYEASLKRSEFCISRKYWEKGKSKIFIEKIKISKKLFVTRVGMNFFDF